MNNLGEQVNRLVCSRSTRARAWHIGQPTCNAWSPLKRSDSPLSALNGLAYLCLRWGNQAHPREWIGFFWSTSSYCRCCEGHPSKGIGAGTSTSCGGSRLCSSCWLCRLAAPPDVHAPPLPYGLIVPTGFPLAWVYAL